LSSAVNAEAYFRFQASPWGISGGPSGTWGRFFSEYLSFPLFSIIAQMLCTDISFMYHRRRLFVAVDSLIKWNISVSFCLSLSLHPKSALFLMVFSSLDELQKPIMCVIVLCIHTWHVRGLPVLLPCIVESTCTFIAWMWMQNVSPNRSCLRIKLHLATFENTVVFIREYV